MHALRIKSTAYRRSGEGGRSNSSRGGRAPVKASNYGSSQIEVFWGARPRPSNEQHAERPGPSNLQRVAGPRALVKVVSNVSFVCGPVLVKSRVESSGDGAFVK